MVTSGITTPLFRRKFFVVKRFVSVPVIFFASLFKWTHPTLPSQHTDHAIGVVQTFGHDRDEIGQELLAEQRMVALDRLELLAAQHIKHALHFRLNRGAPRR